MFESITITRYDQKSDPDGLDFGFLLECLVFYQKVHLVVSERSLGELISFFGEDELLRLLEDGVLVVHYEFELLAVVSNNSNGVQHHSLATLHSPDHSLMKALQNSLTPQSNQKRKSKRNVSRLLPRIKTLSRDVSVVSAASDRLTDDSFVASAASITVQSLMPTYAKPIKFKCERDEKGFVVDTDIPFGFLNAIRKARGQTELSVALVLESMFRVEADLSLSAMNLSEIATNPTGAELIKLRFSHIMNRFEQSEESRARFAEEVLETKALRHLLDRSPESISRIVDAIIDAREFKAWLCTQQPSADLVREYYRRITSVSLFDKLPAKSVRWISCAGLGLLADVAFAGGVGTVLGNAIGAIDAFYLDRWLKGWRPNQFVDERIRPLVKHK